MVGEFVACDLLGIDIDKEDSIIKSVFIYVMSVCTKANLRFRVAAGTGQPKSPVRQKFIRKPVRPYFCYGVCTQPAKIQDDIGILLLTHLSSFTACRYSGPLADNPQAPVYLLTRISPARHMFFAGVRPTNIRVVILKI